MSRYSDEEFARLKKQVREFVPLIKEELDAALTFSQKDSSEDYFKRAEQHLSKARHKIEEAIR